MRPVRRRAGRVVLRAEKAENIARVVLSRGQRPANMRQAEFELGRCGHVGTVPSVDVEDVARLAVTIVGTGARPDPIMGIPVVVRAGVWACISRRPVSRYALLQAVLLRGHLHDLRSGEGGGHAAVTAS